MPLMLPCWYLTPMKQLSLDVDNYHEQLHTYRYSSSLFCITS